MYVTKKEITYCFLIQPTNNEKKLLSISGWRKGSSIDCEKMEEKTLRKSHHEGG